jgi:hypothetical protein
MAQSFARKLYTSKAWTELRFNLIIERGPICQRCGKVMVDTSKLIGHHKITLTPNNVNDPVVTLNPINIELICWTCHNKEPHYINGHSKHDVFIVYGSPLSGKTTLVSQLTGYGDMVLDLDKLYECISGQPLYDKPINLKYNVFALRDKMMDMIKTRYGEWHDAYVIGGYPNKHERERLAKELGAELIYCESTKQECINRAMALSIVKPGWDKFVEKWWKEYIPG